MQRLLGMYLRELRTARGLSLEEVAHATRVARHYLEALEHDGLAELPAPVFTKGYIRAYCQVLGEPPDEALTRYRELVGEAHAAALPTKVTRSLEWRGRGPVLVSLVLLVAFGVGLFVVTRSLQSRTQRVADPAAPPAPQAVLPVSRGVSESQAQAKPDEVKPARLVARTRAPTWISVETDDGRVVQELLPPGAIREWVSAHRFVLTIGNAGGITLELNGQPLPPLGASGAVIRKLVLPAEAGISKP